MAEDLIRYDILAQDALRGLVRKVLSEVSRTGLPGEHHFFVTFATQAPGVRISSRLVAKYPEDMTIVVQHQYWDLSVTEHAFEIGLSFNGIPERLLVPFSAVKAFTDPSVGFQLQFAVRDTAANSDSAPDGEEGDAETSERPKAEVTPISVVKSDADSATEKAGDETPSVSGAAQVVSLDAFRKK